MAYLSTLNDADTGKTSSLMGHETATIIAAIALRKKGLTYVSNAQEPLKVYLCSTKGTFCCQAKSCS